ncbi:MAG: Uma2 family endonuclease [Chloroflexi bacterium]|nr:Uma2 family endonuclease [Chloroflexota bacterium]
MREMDHRAPPSQERIRFSVEQFRALGETAVLPPGERIELIDGEIVRMASTGRRHALRIETLTGLLSALREMYAWRAGWLRLGSHDEVRPDLLLLPRAAAQQEPRPRDILLCVEVAEGSRTYDLEFKMLLYARAGIPEYWVVDLVDRRVVCHREPGPAGYRDRAVRAPGELLAPLHAPGTLIPVATLVA